MYHVSSWRCRNRVDIVIAIEESSSYFDAVVSVSTSSINEYFPKGRPYLGTSKGSGTSVQGRTGCTRALLGHLGVQFRSLSKFLFVL